MALDKQVQAQQATQQQQPTGVESVLDDGFQDPLNPEFQDLNTTQAVLLPSAMLSLGQDDNTASVMTPDGIFQKELDAQMEEMARRELEAQNKTAPEPKPRHGR